MLLTAIGTVILDHPTAFALSAVCLEYCTTIGKYTEVLYTVQHGPAAAAPPPRPLKGRCAAELLHDGLYGRGLTQ